MVISIPSRSLENSRPHWRVGSRPISWSRRTSTRGGYSPKSKGSAPYRRRNILRPKKSSTNGRWNWRSDIWWKLPPSCRTSKRLLRPEASSSSAGSPARWPPTALRIGIGATRWSTGSHCKETSIIWNSLESISIPDRPGRNCLWHMSLSAFRALLGRVPSRYLRRLCLIGLPSRRVSSLFEERPEAARVPFSDGRLSSRPPVSIPQRPDCGRGFKVQSTI